MAGKDFLTKAEIWKVVQTSQGGIILIRPLQSELVVPIFTDPAATQLLQTALKHHIIPGKGIFDSFMNILPVLDAHLVCGEINRHRNSHFSARLIIRHEGADLSLEMAEPDVLILVARAGLPLFIAEDIVEELGTPMSHFQDTPDEGTIDNQRLQHLQEELRRCLEQEEYETAARLRDQIEELEKGGNPAC